MSSLTTTHAPKGLEGVVATNSTICYIDGDHGVLAYRGIDIHDLADHSTFEETCYLLWFGRLPKRNELRELRERLAEERKLDASIINLLRITPKHALPMDVLRTAVSALSFYDPEFQRNDHDANVHKAIRLTSQIAMIVAAYDRIRKGKEVVEPDRSLSHAANFLLLLNGVAPSRTAERALDIALILHARWGGMVKGRGIAILSVLGIIINSVGTALSGQASLVKDVAAMPGVDRVAVNANASPALAQVATDADQPKVGAVDAGTRTILKATAQGV